jgi:mannose-6-phosphate isomerase
MQALEYRPWGTYQVLHDTSEAKVKVIEVEPRSRLSYQYHSKRQEQWTVIYGELTIILDDEKIVKKAGESIFIPLGAKHRAWNETDKPVRFVEVQTGTYFGEDDIVRLEDDYERAELEHLKDGNYIGGLTMPVKNTNKLNKDE